jgi:hypothetical protein
VRRGGEDDDNLLSAIPCDPVDAVSDGIPDAGHELSEYGVTGTVPM